MATTVNEPVQETAASPLQEPGEDRQEPKHQLLEDVIRETELTMAKLEVEEKRFTFQQRRAKLFSASGLFAVKDATADQAIAQAMVKIELGEAMGFSPAEALQGVHIINNATCVAAALRAARMEARGWSWDIDWLGTESDCAGCRLWLYFKGKPLMKPRRTDDGQMVLDSAGSPILEHVSIAYTKLDATRMMTTIWENGQKRRCSILEKDNWKMTPKNMYFARVVTNAQRWYAPGALSVNILSVEEAIDRDPEPPADVRGAPLRASISIGDVRASGQENRGHDRANVRAESPATASGTQTTTQPAATPQAATGAQHSTNQEQKPAEPAKTDTGEPKQAQEGGTAPAGGPDGYPPADLVDFPEWPDNPQSYWIKVNGQIHWYNKATGYVEYRGPMAAPPKPPTIDEMRERMEKEKGEKGKGKR